MLIISVTCSAGVAQHTVMPGTAHLVPRALVPPYRGVPGFCFFLFLMSFLGLFLFFLQKLEKQRKKHKKAENRELKSAPHYSGAAMHLL